MNEIPKSFLIAFLIVAVVSHLVIIALYMFPKKNKYHIHTDSPYLKEDIEHESKDE